MAVKLESLARNPVLGLLLKTLIGALGVYFLRENGSSASTLLIFLVIFWTVYLRPPFNNRRFLVSAISLASLPILLPPVGAGLELILLFVWAGTFFLLLGVKNLILLRRQRSYELAHLFLVFGSGALYFLGFIPLVPQIVLFVVFFLLFREFYFVLAPHYPQRLALAAAVESLLLIQIAWILSFTSLNFLTASSLLVLTTFTLHDLMLHHFQGTVSRQIILRNVALFMVLSIILTLLR